MSLNDPNIKDVVLSEFRGSDTASDAYNIDTSHLNSAYNLQYTVAENGMVQAGTRTGTQAVVTPSAADGSLTQIASWSFVNISSQQKARVVFFAASSGLVKYYDQGSATISGTIMTGPGGTPYANFAFEGLRLYSAFASQVVGVTGAGSGQVFQEGAASASNLFATLATTNIGSITTAAPGAGVITQGTHRIGLLFTTREGYTGILYPTNSSGVFQPVSFTAADGVHNCQVTIPFASVPATFSSGGTFQIVMTTVANPARYFIVPGTTTTTPVSSGGTIVTFSITDGDLVTGTDVTQSQNLLAANVGTGAAPFNPSAMFQYSSRMGYCTYDSAGFPVVYLSDQNNYQVLTAAFHGIYIEGRQIPIQGASLGGVCYIATLSGLYATQDNGGLPTTWIPPSRVDGSVGILAATCMSAATQQVGTATGRIILASEKGLFIFKGGTFPEIPLSYWQTPDWNRIDWTVPWRIQVVDDVYRQTIRVLAPLKVNITNASNANPIVITTALPHLFNANMGVVISGVLVNTNANGTFTTVTVISPTSFSVAATGNGNYGGGGLVTPTSGPNAELSWTYPVGDEPGQPFYALNSWTAYAADSIAVIHNINTQVDEIWYGPQVNTSVTGPIIRRVLPLDQLPQFRDQDMSGNPSAIPAILETALVPNSQDTARTLHDYHGAHFRVSGSGSLAITAFGLDHVRSVVPAASPLTLNVTPGQEVLIKWFLRSEQQSIQVSTNAVDAFFVLARIKAYYTDSVPMR
jgi:hypothetical protein